MTRYAEKTTVSSERSRAEIEKTLARYGATGFIYGWRGDAAMLMFDLENRRVRFVLSMPDRSDDEFWLTPSRGTRRTQAKAEEAYEQAVRQRWRALHLVIKAKLEAVESGITEFDEEFLAHLVMPGTDQTVGQELIPRLERAHETGSMPPLLPHLPS